MANERIALVRVLAFVGMAGLLPSCSGPGGLPEAVCALTFADDTVYAERFSDEQFEAIAGGMTEEEVLRRLGPPIDAPWTPQKPETWDRGMRWSRSGNDSHYKVRVILFREGRVTEKVAEFYVD